MSGVAPNGHVPGHGLDLVPLRPLVEEAIDISFTLAPGDRVIAEEGAAVTVGAPLAERFRDTVLAATTVPEGEDARPGERWTPTEPPVRRGPSRRPARRTGGELLFPWRDGWRVASGEHADPLEAPGSELHGELARQRPDILPRLPGEAHQLVQGALEALRFDRLEQVVD